MRRHQPELTRRTVIASLSSVTLGLAQSTPKALAQKAPPSFHRVGAVLQVSDQGSGLDRVVLLETPGVFRLGFAASDNWGIDTWYDLVNDPEAQTNLLSAQAAMKAGSVLATSPPAPNSSATMRACMPAASRHVLNAASARSAMPSHVSPDCGS